MYLSDKTRKNLELTCIIGTEYLLLNFMFYYLPIDNKDLKIIDYRCYYILLYDNFKTK